ncbi:MAG: FtsQ-type POTRA domain-containing protein [Clostridia bacterium]|nr:FtsQ-type POTRA domain-containing protein [Clostridia bacterium]
MPKKTKKTNKKNIDNEIIIGYNQKKLMDNPPNKTKKQVQKKQSSKKKRKPQIQKKKQQSKKKRKSNIKKFLKILLRIAIVIGIGIAIILFLFVSPVFNIREIRVTGSKEITSSVYIAMSGIEVGENIFEIDKTSAISEISREAYVESVEINSIYPNKIEIIVKERTSRYIVEQNGKYFYIDKNGYVLDASLAPIDLPQIKGISTELEIIGIGRKNR